MACLRFNDQSHAPRHGFVEGMYVFRGNLSPDATHNLFQARNRSCVFPCSRSCACFTWLHRFSIGLRSGLFPSHPLNGFTFQSCSRFRVETARCAGVLSSISSTEVRVPISTPFPKRVPRLLLLIKIERFELQKWDCNHLEDLSL